MVAAGSCPDAGPALPPDRRSGVRAGRRRHRRTSRARVATLLDRLDVGVPSDAHPRDLSEGQRLALVLAAAAHGGARGAPARRADPRPRPDRQGTVLDDRRRPRRRRPRHRHRDPRRRVRRRASPIGSSCSPTARSSPTARPPTSCARRPRSRRRSRRSCTRRRGSRCTRSSRRSHEDDRVKTTVTKTTVVRLRTRSTTALVLVSIAGLMMFCWPFLVTPPSGLATDTTRRSSSPRFCPA